MDKYICEIIKLSEKAAKHKEVPVGAIIVQKNKIIAKTYNKKRKFVDVTAHAEVLAIKKASAKIKDWRLDDCDLYVTLEPCHMCKEIIKEARIKNVYYLLTRQEGKKDFYKTNICTIKNKERKEEYKKILSDFFRLNCNR